MKLTIAALALLAIGFFAMPLAQADVRCDNQLLSTGATMYEAKSICGEPDDAIHRTESRSTTEEVSTPCADRNHRARCSKSVTHTTEIVVDEWTYDFGTNRFIVYLRFENGRLVGIRDGGYGKKNTG
jgi:Protein of unknown function (DUF2845)